MEHDGAVADNIDIQTSAIVNSATDETPRGGENTAVTNISVATDETPRGGEPTGDEANEANDSAPGDEAEAPTDEQQRRERDSGSIKRHADTNANRRPSGTGSG